MPPKKIGVLAAVIPITIVACISLALVGGVVTWMAAREGTSAGELASVLLGGQQSAQPIPWSANQDDLTDTMPYPTYTLQPSLTSTSADTTVSGEPVVGIAPTPQPTDSSLPNAPSPNDPVPPGSMPVLTPQIEAVIESPIRPGSPLPESPATRLVIPVMELDVPVIISPIENQTWKVDHLGSDFVGHLEGTASPGDLSNVVLAGHVTIAHDVYGPFAGLGQLEAGDSIVVYAGDQAYTYIVDYRQLVERTDIHVAYPTDTGRVTLITCSNWSDELGAYQERLIVVGHLADGGS
jgi:LPXTG-site transpeptidase (sortase) family protein